MDQVMLEDIDGNKFKATILLKHFDYNFSKNYMVYLQDKEVLAASYEEIDGKYIINYDLTSSEYDMIDELIESNNINELLKKEK